ncbi:LuxR family transcriptional regulator, partial [Vibrio parahaemolyticus]
GDEGALRNIARRMVDSRLTDNKKRMLALKKQDQGLSQKAIAQKLTELGGKKITPQAVSKALGTVRDEFLLLR